MKIEINHPTAGSDVIVKMILEDNVLKGIIVNKRCLIIILANDINVAFWTISRCDFSIIFRCRMLEVVIEF